MRIFEYCKTTLTAPQKDAYQRIVYGVTSRHSTIDCGPVSGSDALAAWVAVDNDHPELFYIGHTASAQSRNSFNLSYGLTTMTDIILSFPYDTATISSCEKKTGAGTRADPPFGSELCDGSGKGAYGI